MLSLVRIKRSQSVAQIEEKARRFSGVKAAMSKHITGITVHVNSVHMDGAILDNEHPVRLVILPEQYAASRQPSFAHIG